MDGDGDYRIPAEPAGIPRGWKLMLRWTSPGMEQNCTGFTTRDSHGDVAVFTPPG